MIQLLEKERGKHRFGIMASARGGTETECRCAQIQPPWQSGAEHLGMVVLTITISKSGFWNTWSFGNALRKLLMHQPVLSNTDADVAIRVRVGMPLVS